MSAPGKSNQPQKKRVCKTIAENGYGNTGEKGKECENENETNNSKWIHSFVLWPSMWISVELLGPMERAMGNVWEKQEKIKLWQLLITFISPKACGMWRHSTWWMAQAEMSCFAIVFTLLLLLFLCFYLRLMWVEAAQKNICADTHILGQKIENYLGNCVDTQRRRRWKRMSTLCWGLIK